MKKIASRVSNIVSLSPTVIELTVVRENGQPYPYFIPGQYGTISFPTDRTIRGERSFSIASSPADLTSLKFGIRVHGKYTTELTKLKRGDRAAFAGPFGQFTFDPIKDSSVVFIAGGIGITPFMSMVRTAQAMGLPNDLTLCYSIRSLSDAPYRDELDAYAKANPRFRVVYAVSDGKIPAGAKNMYAGRVTPEMLAAVFQDGDWYKKSTYLCGPPPFMQAVVKSMTALGLPEHLIRSERFAVASSAIIEPGSVVPKLAFTAWGVAAALIFAVVVHGETEKRDAVNAANQLPVTPQTTVPTTTQNSNVSTNSPSVNTNTRTTTNTTPSTTYTPPTQTYTPPAQTYTPPVRTMPRTRLS